MRSFKIVFYPSGIHAKYELMSRFGGVLVRVFWVAALGFAALSPCAPAEARPTATAWRVGVHDGLTRLVIEVTEPVSVRLEARDDQTGLDVSLDGLDWATGTDSRRAGVLTRAKVEANGEGTRLALTLGRPARSTSSFLLQPSEGYSYRLVIDIDATPANAPPAAPPASDPPRPEPAKLVPPAVKPPTPKAPSVIAAVPVTAPTPPEIKPGALAPPTPLAPLSPLTLPTVTARAAPARPEASETAVVQARKPAPVAAKPPVAPTIVDGGSPFAPGSRPSPAAPTPSGPAAGEVARADPSPPDSAPAEPIPRDDPPRAGGPLVVTVPIQSSQALANPPEAVVGLMSPGSMAPLLDNRPLIAVDPGHGGTDPGATSVGGVFEKQLTLKIGQALRDELQATGRFRVVMTREDDRFVPLRERVAKARAKGAAVFVSLHADVLSDPDIAGLSVYTLSETASDKEAEALAVKENKADVITGVDLSAQPAEVTRTLIDLAQRETNGLSVSLARSLVRELGAETKLLPQTHRSAGFAVLTAPDIPSVLIELGYLSNRDDEAGLRAPDHQKQLARGIRRALEAYFAGQGRLRRV